MAPLGSVAGRKLAALTTELGGRVGTPGGVPAWVTVRICPPVMVSVPMREPGSGLAATAYCTRSVPPPLVPEVMVIQLTSLLAFQSQRVEISTLPVPPLAGNDALSLQPLHNSTGLLSCTRLSAFFVVSALRFEIYPTQGGSRSIKDRPKVEIKNPRQDRPWMIRRLLDGVM